MNSLRWDVRLSRKLMNECRRSKNWQELKKLLKCFGMALLITLAFFGLMSIIQAIPK